MLATAAPFNADLNNIEPRKADPLDLEVGDRIISPVDFVVLLYYSYIEIQDVPGAINWHSEAAIRFGLKGRIRISSEGLNVVLDGLREKVGLYIETVRS